MQIVRTSERHMRRFIARTDGCVLVVHAAVLLTLLGGLSSGAAAKGLVAFQAAAADVEALLKQSVPQEQKIEQCRRLIAELEKAANAAAGTERAPKLRALLEDQQDVLLSLTDPQEAVKQAWAAFDGGKYERSVRLGRLIVSNPNYEAEDVELVLGYWLARAERFNEAREHLAAIASREGARHRDLAIMLRGWVNLQMADLVAAKGDFDRLLAQFPESRYAPRAQTIEASIRKIVEPAKDPRQIEQEPKNEHDGEEGVDNQ